MLRLERDRRRRLLLLVLMVPGFARDGAAGDLPDIMRSGAIRALVAADESPEFFALAPGPSPGFEREILEGFARLHKVRLEVVPIVRFDDAIPALLQGQGDLVTGIIDTEARRKQVAFSVEILPSRLLLVTRAPLVLKSLADLGGQRVGVVSGTTWGEAAVSAGVPQPQISSLPDLKNVLGALHDRKLGAAVMSLADLVLERHRDPQLQAGPFLGPLRSAAWAVRKADVQLRRALSDHVESLRRTPSWSRMALTYFGRDALNLLGRAKTE